MDCADQYHEQGACVRPGKYYLVNVIILQPLVRGCSLPELHQHQVRGLAVHKGGKEELLSVRCDLDGIGDEYCSFFFGYCCHILPVQDQLLFPAKYVGVEAGGSGGDKESSLVKDILWLQNVGQIKSP